MILCLSVLVFTEFVMKFGASMVVHNHIACSAERLMVSNISKMMGGTQTA